jgi:hypothetical protein
MGVNLYKLNFTVVAEAVLIIKNVLRERRHLIV